MCFLRVSSSRHGDNINSEALMASDSLRAKSERKQGGLQPGGEVCAETLSSQAASKAPSKELQVQATFCPQSLHMMDSVTNVERTQVPLLH